MGSQLRQNFLTKDQSILENACNIWHVHTLKFFRKPQNFLNKSCWNFPAEPAFRSTYNVMRCQKLRDEIPTRPILKRKVTQRSDHVSAVLWNKNKHELNITHLPPSFLRLLPPEIFAKRRWKRAAWLLFVFQQKQRRFQAGRRPKLISGNKCLLYFTNRKFTCRL